MITYYCPEGCIWELPIELAVGKYGIHSGISCPTHLLFCAQQGRPRAS